MGISFGVVVDCNNLLALKSFTTFLFNFEIHESPSFWERWLIKRAKAWIYKEAYKTFVDLQKETSKYEINIGLNECSTGMFTCLHLAERQIKASDKMKIKDGIELFQMMAEMELEFERLKHPKENSGFKNA